MDQTDSMNVQVKHFPVNNETLAHSRLVESPNFAAEASLLFLSLSGTFYLHKTETRTARRPARREA